MHFFCLGTYALGFLFTWELTYESFLPAMARLRTYIRPPTATTLFGVFACATGSEPSNRRANRRDGSERRRPSVHSDRRGRVDGEEVHPWGREGTTAATAVGERALVGVHCYALSAKSACRPSIAAAVSSSGVLASSRRDGLAVYTRTRTRGRPFVRRTSDRQTTFIPQSFGIPPTVSHGNRSSSPSLVPPHGPRSFPSTRVSGHFPRPCAPCRA